VEGDKVISVVVPAYNAEKTIGSCVRSLQKQSYGGQYEVIVVDDGSSDNTACAAAQANARVISQKNMGPAAARNRGARSAKGSIILFTDADCVADRNWIKEMISSFTDVRIAGVQGKYRTRQSGLIPVFVQEEIEQRYQEISRQKSIEFVGSYAAGYRKKAFLSVNGFDESFPQASGEDADLSFRLAKKGKRMVFNPRAIVYHTHPESLFVYLRSKYYRGYWGRLLYRKHPGKKRRGSYRSGSFFYGIALTALLSLLFLVSIPISLFASLVFLIMLAGTVIYESAHFMISNRRLVLASPFLVFLRNIALGLGIIAAFGKGGMEG
jgi:cellulose synthase/poly-beta-1,6-N-acetylglucosamine synthase-like glycosyltransferase